MLNPPFSSLSDDLLAYIVDHLAQLPLWNESLYNLSLTDRAFTRFCQKHIFKTLRLGYHPGSRREIVNKMAKMQRILDDDPSIANSVRIVHLSIQHKKNAWLFNDSTFMGIIELLAKSPRVPHALHLYVCKGETGFEDPVLVIGRLLQSFFAHSLTVLNLNCCKQAPLCLFLVCPRLKEVLLDYVVAEKSYDQYPDHCCYGREPPALERLDYRDSQSLVKQMLAPPPPFQESVVRWSDLRFLTLSPHEKEEMACLQPILDAACDTLEELRLTNLRVIWGSAGQSGLSYRNQVDLTRSQNEEQLSLAPLVDLKRLSQLRVFALHAAINFLKLDTPQGGVLQDINSVLCTIPTSHKIEKLTFDFTINDKHPFVGCLGEDWGGLCDKVIHISAGRPLQFNLMTAAACLRARKPFGESKLYKHIGDKISMLSDYPNIHTEFWNPVRWKKTGAPTL